MKNPVAKNTYKFNKPKVYTDKKKEAKKNNYDQGRNYNVDRDFY